ncbi:MAG: CBS domain-containing protein [Treponemataceae bacterium]
MIVSKFMTRNPIYVHPETSINDAKALMTKHQISKLPVLDQADRLIGIITKQDLVNAAPSAATTLDMYEISYLLSKLTVKKIMKKNVFTVKEDEVIEEAALKMADEKVGCLPVLKEDLLVGIITESDVFHAFIDMLGARHEGVRITMILDEKPGQLSKITKAVADLGGNFVSLVTGEGDNLSKRRCSSKITKLSFDQVKKLLSDLEIEIEDIR